MSRINTEYFDITDKCALLFSDDKIRYKDGLPFCVYFDTSNGEPRCRQKDICDCVKVRC